MLPASGRRYKTTKQLNNEKHNEVLRDKDKIIESLEREVNRLNEIIKENL